MLAGKRTYIASSVVVVHQILKFLGYDIPHAELSSALDVVAGIAAFLFRMIAKPK